MHCVDGLDDAPHGYVVRLAVARTVDLGDEFKVGIKWNMNITAATAHQPGAKADPSRVWMVVMLFSG